MPYGPDIPAVDHEVFAKPPLKAMLGQIRFLPVLKVADTASLIAFQEVIRHEFPTFDREQQFSLVFGPQGPQGASSQEAFRFSTSDGAWSALLTTEALTLEADVAVRYTSYDEFGERFRLVWQALVDVFNPTHVSRQGLRYVDHIEGERPAAEWATLIKQELLGPLVGAFATSAVQSVSELRFPREDGVIVFKHGVLPLGPQGSIGYLLDFDYFTEEPVADASVESVMDRFDSYHRALYSFFRWCLTDEALRSFRDAG